MAAEERKVSSELNEEQLALQKKVLSNVTIYAFYNEESNAAMMINSTNKKPNTNKKPVSRMMLSLPTETLALKGDACHSLVDDIFKYLNSMGTKYINLTRWGTNNHWIKDEVLPVDFSTEFIHEFFKALAELRSLKNVSIMVASTINPRFRKFLDEMLYFVENGHLDKLTIFCGFLGEPDQVLASERKLFAAIAKSQISTLNITGPIYNPDIFSEAVNKSRISTLDLSDFPTRKHRQQSERDAASMTSQHLQCLARNLNTSTVKMVLLPDALTSDELVNFVSHIAERIFVPMAPQPVRIPCSPEMMTEIIGYNLAKVVEAIENSVPDTFPEVLNEVIGQYLFLPSQPFLRTAPTQKTVQWKARTQK